VVNKEAPIPEPFRRMRTSRFALAFCLILAACGTNTRPPPAPPPPSTQRPGLDPVAGQWDAGMEASLRSAPSAGAPVIGKLKAGQPVTVSGRVRNTDWLAVPYGGTTGYVRLHLLRLRETQTTSFKGNSTVVPKPEDNAGPKVNAAPRRKIEAAPISAQ